MTGNKAGRVARLLLDVGIFAFGSLLSKIVQFLLLPLYTGWMSPGEFGVAEIVFNLSQLLMPLATLSVANGVFRYAMDRVASFVESFRRIDRRDYRNDRRVFDDVVQAV